MTDLTRLWDSLENFSGESAALQRDQEDKVHITICPSPRDGEVYALSDPEWIHWQNVIEATPRMLELLRNFIRSGTVGDEGSLHNCQQEAMELMEELDPQFMAAIEPQQD